MDHTLNGLQWGLGIKKAGQRSPSLEDCFEQGIKWSHPNLTKERSLGTSLMCHPPRLCPCSSYMQAECLIQTSRTSICGHMHVCVSMGLYFCVHRGICAHMSLCVCMNVCTCLCAWVVGAHKYSKRVSSLYPETLHGYWRVLP